MAAADFSTPLPQASPAPDVTTGSLRALISKAAWLSTLSKLKAISGSFFNPLEFSKPASQAEWLMRVSANAKRFKLMYGVIFLPVLISTMLSSYFRIVGVLLILGLWFYAYGIKRGDAPLEMFGFPVPKVIACSVSSVLIMLFSGMVNGLLYALVLFAVVAMPHMSFHIAADGDALDAVELQGLGAPSF